MTRKYLSYLFCLIAGALYPLALAPLNIYPLAIISCAVLLFFLQSATLKDAFFYGGSFGLGLFGVGSSWVYVSISQFGNAGSALSALITALFTVCLALFPASQAVFYTFIRRRRSSLGLSCLILFPSTWVLWEWVRSWILTGFPWLYAGYSQLHSPLRGYAPLVGVYGLSWITLFLSGTLVYLVLNKKNAGLLYCV